MTIDQPNISNPRYSSNSADEDDIFAHLVKVDEQFAPTLSSRINLSSYAGKIFTYATNFEVWEETLLIGMINAYTNDPDSKMAYITNVSMLKEYQGLGLAGHLLENCLLHCKEIECEVVSLHLSIQNTKALNFYQKYKFIQLPNSQNNLNEIYMECSLDNITT